MASRGMVMVAVCMVVVAMMSSAAMQQAEAAVTCGDVVRNLTPCISYVMNGGAIPFGCCNGVTALYGAAKTPGDRQTVCKCIKSAVGGSTYSSFNLGLAAGLPDKCGLHLPYKISPATDCNQIQ